MTTILHIKSSSNLQGSVTRQIGGVAIETLMAQNNGATIIERDLIKNPVSHITPEFVGTMFSGNTKAKELSFSNQLIDELFASDIIIIEAPMYNLVSLQY